jgi:hypothetical protein
MLNIFLKQSLKQLLTEETIYHSAVLELWLEIFATLSRVSNVLQSQLSEAANIPRYNEEEGERAKGKGNQSSLTLPLSPLPLTLFPS